MIPKSIDTRLSNISNSEKIFNKAKQEYERALQETGHKTSNTYNSQLITKYLMPTVKGILCFKLSQAFCW